MSRNRAQQRAARQRAAATGENYTTARTALLNGPLYLLTITTKHGDSHELYTSEAAAKDAVYGYVVENWAEQYSEVGRAEAVPQDHDEAISAYFEDSPEDDWAIAPISVAGAPRGPEPLDVDKLDLAALGKDELLALLQRTNDEWRARSESSFVEVLKEVLSADKDVRGSVEMHGPVVRAVFPTTDYDNGWFFDEHSPTLTYEDGTTESAYLQLPIEARALGREMATVSDAYQPLGSTATYTVDLLTGDTDQDDYGDDGFGERKATETTVVHIGSTPGEQYGWECAGCDGVSGLQWGTNSDAQTALDRHLEAGCADLIKLRRTH